MRPRVYGSLTSSTAIKVRGLEPNTRFVPVGPQHEVIDIIRPRRLALVVCVRCGASWEEGEETLVPCVRLTSDYWGHVAPTGGATPMIIALTALVVAVLSVALGYVMGWMFDDGSDR